VEYGSDQKRFESVFSKKVRAGKRRTYFFDVRRTKGDDFYVTLTESTRKFDDGGYERHKIFLYKEDFNRFLTSLTETIDHVKTELMPDYDYDEFTRRQLEWEEKRRLEMEAEAAGETVERAEPKKVEEVKAEKEVKEVKDEKEDEEVKDEKEDESKSSEPASEDDMSW